MALLKMCEYNIMLARVYKGEYVIIALYNTYL